VKILDKQLLIVFTAVVEETGDKKTIPIPVPEVEI